MNESIFDHPPWFDIGRYAATDRLDFEGWRTQIGNRIFLNLLLNTSREEEFDQYFSEIKAGPFMDLGFEANFSSGKATYPLTFGVANTMVAALVPHSPDRKMNCDEMLSEIGEDSFAMHAHLTIDFNASETEIIDDFKAWLALAIEKNRKQFPRKREAPISDAVIKSWHDHQILPYEDLRLWHMRKGSDLPGHKILAHWLFSETDSARAGKGIDNKVRDTITKASSAFKLATLQQLYIAAE
ncbi:MAG: DUF6387 family protein [Burkholderiaceae bacterium]